MTVLRTSSALAEAGLIAPDRVASLQAVAARYAVAITPVLAELIDPADPRDPIARQFTPSEAELDVAANESPDPIGDHAHMPVPGVVHRYPDRVLLKVTHTCAVYCRFCFRREMVGPGGEAPLTGEALETALAYIAGRPEIWEVILTGGDPLVLSPRRLGEIMARLAEIEHVKVVRLHTRLPTADPDAITPELTAALACPGKAVWLAVHANHARELTPAARAACGRLIAAGLALVSQTVLLAGVNDDPETLGALMRAFVETRIKPYYLHQMDLAPGTGHLRVPIARGQAILAAMRGRLSGLAQPTYVLDIPGGHGKVPIGPGYLGCGPDGEIETVADPWGGTHSYPPRN
ncbi:lysine 2,3-aminomutase [Caulobacter ginsengisoli]|uniref:Lysine 2,3-aminomutase n=1 Tax=Caulobacter ginsengisoli TaxID=400775 RepID=A0ABU0IMW9_9CAUL|nr:lysine-2,3-aminomutase-like protein [Caulobacter ginsengisoli]MDQ0463356.1 lysine 2,3-aminomutase [Caulobacter ginsengisoli]